MAIADALTTISVSELDLSRYAAVDRSWSVAATVQAMRDSGESCACIVTDDSLAGIFTQRDVLMRVIGRSWVCDVPISEEMTRPVRTMKADQSVADGLAIMGDWWVRSVPVLDDEGHLVGNLSWYAVMRAIAGLLRQPTDETEPAVEHGLEFIDFTGLNTSAPVAVSVEDTAEIAVHHMKARAIGSVLVLDSREQLVGLVTEFDLLMKLGCTQDDLSTLTVGEIMTPNPVTLSARSPIVDAIQQMAARGFSHAPLMGESSRPVGVASFRDVAAYFESSLESLG